MHKGDDDDDDDDDDNNNSLFWEMFSLFSTFQAVTYLSVTTNPLWQQSLPLGICGEQNSVGTGFTANT